MIVKPSPNNSKVESSPKSPQPLSEISSSSRLLNTTESWSISQKVAKDRKASANDSSITPIHPVWGKIDPHEVPRKLPISPTSDIYRRIESKLYASTVAASNHARKKAVDQQKMGKDLVKKLERKSEEEKQNDHAPERLFVPTTASKAHRRGKVVVHNHGIPAATTRGKHITPPLPVRCGKIGQRILQPVLAQQAEELRKKEGKELNALSRNVPLLKEELLRILCVLDESKRVVEDVSLSVEDNVSLPTPPPIPTPVPPLDLNRDECVDDSCTHFVCDTAVTDDDSAAVISGPVYPIVEACVGGDASSPFDSDDEYW